ncbi:MAG TPA: LysR family transcriptional regulator [Polyangiaceae bacterium]
MNDVHLAGVDLNLLTALEALLAERNVTKAAARVGVTQSAMSHSLARLRALTNDPLLVRSTNEMVPTARAEALAVPVANALREIRQALAPLPAFDPKTSTLRVSLATSDFAELVLLPKLLARLAKEAPLVEVRAKPVEEAFAERLANGVVDIAIQPTMPPITGAALYSRKLFDERFVVVMRKKNPLADKKLTLARFVEASHALIAPRGAEGGFVDDALARLGKKRRVVVAVPHFLIAPHIVAKTDFVLTLAERMAKVLESPLDLVQKPLPPELGLQSFTMALVWHERTQNDPAQKWFRDLIADVTKTV